LSLFFITSLKEKKWSDHLLFVLTLLSIVLTYSRTGWLGYAIGLLPIVMFLSYKKGAKKLILFTLVLFFIIFIFYLSSVQFQSRLDSLLNFDQVNSFKAREELWARRMIDISNNPFGYGVGAGSWSVHDVMKLGSDSNYLKFVIELGILGGVVAISFIGYCFITITKYYFGNLSKKITIDIKIVYIISVYGFLVSVLIQMYTNQVLEAYPSNAYFWYLTGLGVLLCKRSQY
jgi:hypothetical protein